MKRKVWGNNVLVSNGDQSTVEHGLFENVIRVK